jgi:nucleotide-binding universal stress UspA family protein
MYDTVLFPTDGSEGADAALEHATDIAKRYDATVHVLYVADTNRDSVSTVGGGVVDALEREGGSVVDDVVDRVEAAGVDAVGEVMQGDPYRTILDYVDERGVDIVVMPTHGRRGIDRILIGSVTEKVVRASSAPVLTVRMED